MELSERHRQHSTEQAFRAGHIAQGRAYLDHLLQFLLVVLVLRSLEGVAPHQHYIQHHAARPDV